MVNPETLYSIYEPTKAPVELLNLLKDLPSPDRKQKKIVLISLDIQPDDLGDPVKCDRCDQITVINTVPAVFNRGAKHSTVVAVALEVPVFMCVNPDCPFLDEMAEFLNISKSEVEPYYIVPDPVKYQLAQQAAKALSNARDSANAWDFQQIAEEMVKQYQLN